jgi:hypothetical protein
MFIAGAALDLIYIFVLLLHSRATLASMRPVEDPILKRFRARLVEIYDQRLERVVL